MIKRVLRITEVLLLLVVTYVVMFHEIDITYLTKATLYHDDIIKAICKELYVMKNYNRI